MEIPALVALMRRQQATAGPPGEERRRESLRGLLAGLQRREADLLEALRQDLRKSPTEAFTTEVGYVAGEIRHALGSLRRWMKPERRPAPFMAWPASGWVEKQPYGCGLILGPWNYPIQLVLTPLVGALAAGCRAVVKPSELAPHSSEVLCRLIGEVFPPEEVLCVSGDHRVAEALLAERFDVVFFTGGGLVGRKVMAAAARHLTPVTLELGGRSPCIISQDAPLELTARRIAWGKWLNAGQTCVAPDHVWVPRGTSQRWVEAFARVIAEFYGSDAQSSPDYGRIIHARHFDRLTGYLGEGRVAHGGRHDAADLYVEPTVLTDLPADAAILQEEVFGPILPLVEYDSLDELLERQRSGPAPLALYLFTADRAVQKRVLAGSRSGGACINDTLTHILGKHLPLGGLGESGMGFCHGRASFDAFTHRRSVLRRDLGMDVKMRYPPARIPLDRLKRALRWFGNA